MQRPDTLLIFFACAVGAGMLVFLLWLNHQWATRHERRAARASDEGAAIGWLELAAIYVLGRAEPVKDYEGGVMSRADEDTPARASSSLQTDDPQTPDRPVMPVPTADEMLDIFRVLRAAGVKREALSGAWRAAGFKLDNNLWAKAAPPPPEESATVTPIAGRPTSAKFHDDPELEYQPLR